MLSHEKSIFFFCRKFVFIARKKIWKSESNFLASLFGSEPVASRWCAVYYLWVRLFAPKSVSSRTINFRNRPNSRMQMLPGGRTGKKHSNIVISNTLRATRKCPLPSQTTWGFSLTDIYMLYSQTDTCCCCASAGCFLDARREFLLLNWALARLQRLPWRDSWIETDPCQDAKRPSLKIWSLKGRPSIKYSKQPIFYFDFPMTQSPGSQLWKLSVTIHS